jgi:multiple sugar transport system permease protein
MRNERWFPYFLIAPTVILIAMLMFFPIAQVFNLSVRTYSLTSFSEVGKFIGIQNFEQMFQDGIFFKSLQITFKWVFFEVFLQLVIGIIAALLLNKHFKGKGVARAVTFVPWAVSGVLTSMLWLLMFDQSIGVINDILKRFSLIHDNVAWLANPKMVFPSIIIAELWRGIPFFAITILAALQSISADLYEASDIDGCNKTQRFFYIVLPLLMESIVFSTLLRAIWEFNSVDMIFSLTGGGPARMTMTLPIYLMQTAIVGGDYGYGSTLAAFTFLFLLIFAIIYLRITKGGTIDEKA